MFMLKKICICIFFQILSIFAIKAQIQNKQIKPVSFSYYSDINPLKNDSYIKEIIFPKLNRDSLIKLDDSVYDDNLNTPFRFGFPLDSEINLDNSGLWDTLDNGGRIWRLRVVCPDAYCCSGSSVIIINETNELKKENGKYQKGVIL